MEEFASDGYVAHGSVLFEVTKGLYGLPQAGLLAQQRFVEDLANAGHNQCPLVPCLFRPTPIPLFSHRLLTTSASSTPPAPAPNPLFPPFRNSIP